MDNFDGYTTYKHPSNPVSVDAEKRDAYLRIREQDAKIKRMAEALKELNWGIGRYGADDMFDWRERHADALRDAGVGE